jgi:hypothetical protein
LFIIPEFHSGIPLFPFRRFTFGFDFVSYQGYFPVSIPLGAQPAKRFLFLGSSAGYHPAAHSCESSRSLIVHFCRIIATTILFVPFAVHQCRVFFLRRPLSGMPCRLYKNLH